LLEAFVHSGRKSKKPIQSDIFLVTKEDFLFLHKVQQGKQELSSASKEDSCFLLVCWATLCQVL
jgi:hypothetical protein